MATVQSIPARQQQQQQHPSMIKIPILNCYYHFGLKTRTSRWLTRLECIHSLVLLAFNSSSMMYTPDEWTFAERCSLSPTKNHIKNIHSYTSMNIINSILCLCSMISMVLAQWFFKEVSPVHFSNLYRWFCWCRKILIYLICSSIFNQLASAAACRPIEILYDLRYQSMIIVQLVGFFICLLFSFFLGIKFASVKSKHRL
ncbi:unnamed protein product [Rotaria magnacalcarata]